jgi:hypothetical protein
MMLIAVMFDAPVIGVLRRWPNRVHAIEMEAVAAGWERGTFKSACGVTGLRFWGLEVENVLCAAPFPPRVKGMPDGLVRCRECWVLTGKKRPRVEWRGETAA